MGQYRIRYSAADVGGRRAYLGRTTGQRDFHTMFADDPELNTWDSREQAQLVADALGLAFGSAYVSVEDIENPTELTEEEELEIVKGLIPRVSEVLVASQKFNEYHLGLLRKFMGKVLGPTVG